MFLVISKKTNLVHGKPVIDIQSVKHAVISPQGSISKQLDTPDEVNRYVQQQTLQGFVCHVFGYVESFTANTSVTSVKVA